MRTTTLKPDAVTSLGWWTRRRGSGKVNVRRNNYGSRSRFLKRTTLVSFLQREEFLYLLLLILFLKQSMRVVNFSLGIHSQGPLPVPDVTIRQYDPDSFILAKRSTQNQRRLQQEKPKRSSKRNNHHPYTRIYAYDEAPSIGHKRGKLPKVWDLVSSNEGIPKDLVDSNTCFVDGRRHVQCLPSFIIFGFEKCSTSALNIWLGYHPNLLSSWFENRFFDSVVSAGDLEKRWTDYLRSLPYLPGGQTAVGKYWTFEKSPGYATGRSSADISSMLLPNATLIVLARDPTERAYSHFKMLCSHYEGASNALRRQPLSFFVKNIATGDIRYTRDIHQDLLPGAGGTILSQSMAPTNDTWQYLPYPPDPKDFHSFVKHQTSKTRSRLKLEDQSRPNRVIAGGLYSRYIMKLLKYYPPENIVVIPSSEEFFAPANALDSIEKLQITLGLPVFDYRKVVVEDGDMHRMELQGSFGATFNSFLNGHADAKPMLPRTRELLDRFYCETNLELSQMLGGRRLPFACASSQPESTH